MRAYERLLEYVKYNTQSDENSGTHPSTARQFELAKRLESELSALGLSNVRLDGKCYVYAELPATKGYEDRAALGFIAHMDTSPDASGEGVRPRIIENYDGGDVALGESGLTLSVAEFPHLPALRGRTLITTDGTTLLGSDDKAGVAEIMTALETVITEGVSHGKLCVAFTPDEEIGEGADFFDVEGFGADFAYTVDGGAEGEFEYENFNAASAKFEITGKSVHPGDAKDVMINASLVACEINSMLPSADVPSKTEGYEGFYHMTGISGDVSRATVSYIVRDHDLPTFEARKKTLLHIEKVLCEKYGDGAVKLTLRDQYYNMKEKIEPYPQLLENASRAAEACGVKLSVHPIRGGTDGARLSFMGLPCPNLGTGGYAFHGPFEHVTAEGMDKASLMLVELVKLFGKMKKNK